MTGIRSLYLIVLLFGFTSLTLAQVGIGTSTVNSSAKLQIDATDKGFLPPRVALTATNSSGPITSPVEGLLVYNTATAGSSPNNVTPGFYYYSGSAWVRLIVPTDKAANVTGTIAIANGGTGATSESSARTNLGIGNVDNTSDLNKPISTATQTSLDLKENLSNKSTSTSLGNSDTYYPTQNAVKSYVDGQLVSNATPDATTVIKGKVLLAGDLSGTASSPTVAPGAITTAKLADASVTTAKITDANITTSKIADAAVTTAKLADVSVTDVKIVTVAGSKVTGNISGNAANVTGKVEVANGGTGTMSGSITGTEALIFAAGGSNQNVTLTPSGSGYSILNGNVGIGITTPNAKLDIRTNPTSTTDPGDGYLGVGTTSTAANTAGAGALRYNTSNGGLLEYSNGSSWNTVVTSGSGNIISNYSLSDLITGTTTISTLYDYYRISTAGSATAITITLPAISSLSAYGYKAKLTFADVGGNVLARNIIIQTSNSDTVVGGTAFTLTANYSSVTLVAVHDVVTHTDSWIIL